MAGEAINQKIASESISRNEVLPVVGSGSLFRTPTSPAAQQAMSPPPSKENGDGGRQRRGTYDGQPSLPRLPIPSLEETLERFPSVVSALLSSSSNGGGDGSGRDRSEMQECLDEVQRFLTTDGPALQKLLVEYDERGREDGTVGSFVEEFWTEAYLAPDSSVVMNLNPFFVLEVRCILDSDTMILLLCSLARGGSWRDAFNSRREDTFRAGLGCGLAQGE